MCLVEHMRGQGRRKGGGGIIGLLGSTVIAVCRSKDSCSQLDFVSAKRADSEIWWGREDVLPKSTSS